MKLVWWLLAIGIIPAIYAHADECTAQNDRRSDKIRVVELLFVTSRSPERAFSIPPNPPR
jgi:hypothetical protein